MKAIKQRRILIYFIVETSESSRYFNAKQIKKPLGPRTLRKKPRRFGFATPVALEEHTSNWI